MASQPVHACTLPLGWAACRWLKIVLTSDPLPSSRTCAAGKVVRADTVPPHGLQSGGAEP